MIQRHVNGKSAHPNPRTLCGRGWPREMCEGFLQFYILAKKKYLQCQQQFNSSFIMLLITISPETMVFHLPRAPPRSHLLSVPSFAVFACFWLVVVYEITDRQPSKASVYFIVVILPSFDSNAEQLRLPPAVRLLLYI